MVISFCNQDHYYGGLSNDGGSRTIIKSVDMLRQLGHEAYIVTKSDKHSWIPHDRPLKSIPQNSDVCVAISVSAIPKMLEQAPKKARKFYWMRGWENWQCQEEEIIKRCKQVKVLVNSTWLQKKLLDLGIRSSVIFSGIDIAEWTNKETRRDSGKTVIGCLYHTKKSKRWKDFERLASILRSFSEKKFSFVAFGATSFCAPPWIDMYLKHPEHAKLEHLYSSCHVWFSPTILEGFHNVPAEAALCGSLVVCNKFDSNGMGDYADDSTAMRYDTLQEAAYQCVSPIYEKVPLMISRLHEIGDREKNMRKLLVVIQ